MSEWIKFDGVKSPVHKNTFVDILYSDGSIWKDVRAEKIHWGRSSLSSYRIAEQSMEEAYEDADKPIRDGYRDSALNVQIGGSHYKQLEIQPVTYINANKLDFLQGNVIKYISRHKLKGGKADIEKAIHFCKLILELQYEGE